MPHSHLQRSHHFFKQFGDLHVIAIYINPMRYVSRITMFHEFVDRAVQQGAKVHVAEVAFRERPFEVQDRGQHSHFRYRSKHELWLKENVIDATVPRLPNDFEYLAWVDGDVAFTNPHWVQETIQQLQHFPIVQMWHTAMDLDPSNNVLGSFRSFASCWAEGMKHPAWKKKGMISQGAADPYYYYPMGKGPLYWHPGYAWACRRDAWDRMGGLLDINIVGGGDHQMAHGLFGKIEVAIPFVATESYKRAVLSWQHHARRLDHNLGFVPGALLHYWHGKKIKRGYWDRWKILASNNFDPQTDLRRDWQGLYQLAGNKPRLRDDLRAYFRARNEDSIDV